MRSLIDWVASAEVTGDVYGSALYTIISKATADEMDREALISAVFAIIKREKKGAATEKSSGGRKIAITLPLIMAIAGLCVAANNKFNLYLTGVLPTAIFFPIYNVGILILTTISAIFIFKERLSLKQWIGVAIGIISVVCIRNPFA